MFNKEIKQNPTWEKNRNTNFYIIYTAQRLYWWALTLVCVCVFGYWCSPGVCADMVPEESQCVLAVGVHVVCLQLLWTLESMWHVVTCVFCHVSKSFCFFLYNSFSSSSSTAAGIPGDLDVIQPRPPYPNPALKSLTFGQEGRSSVPLARGPPCSHLRVSGWGGWWHLGNTCLLSSSLPESALSNPKPNTSNTDGIHGR